MRLSRPNAVTTRLPAMMPDAMAIAASTLIQPIVSHSSRNASRIRASRSEDLGGRTNAGASRLSTKHSESGWQARGRRHRRVHFGYTPARRGTETDNTSRLGLLCAFETPPDGGLEPNETKGATMSKIGYARVSTFEQRLDVQIAVLKEAGCDVVRAEKRSGTSTQGRDELRTILDFIHAGDVLTVTRIDRLARSIGDLQDIVRELKAKGATLKATEQPIDTSSAAGKAFLDMLGVFAEFETNLRRERQMEGIAAAKLKGVYKGRPPSIDSVKVAALKAKGLGATAIAKRLKVGRASVYRLLA